MPRPSADAGRVSAHPGSFHARSQNDSPGDPVAVKMTSVRWANRQLQEIGLVGLDSYEIVRNDGHGMAVDR